MSLLRVLFALVLAAHGAATGPGAVEPPAGSLPAPAHGPAPSTTLADLSWLAGHWLGEGLGGLAEEVWLPERGGAMLGTFRSVKDGGVAFYEILTLAPGASGVLELRLKHFHADLKGWEERDQLLTFALTAAETGFVAFGPITFRRAGADGLEIVVAMTQKDGTRREEPFRFRRVR